MRLVESIVALAIAIAVANPAAGKCRANKLFKKVLACAGTGSGLDADTLQTFSPDQLVDKVARAAIPALREAIAEAIYFSRLDKTLAAQLCDCAIAACNMGDQILSCGAIARLSDNRVAINFFLREATTIDITDQPGVLGCEVCGCNIDATASVTLSANARCFRKQ